MLDQKGAAPILREFANRSIAKGAGHGARSCCTSSEADRVLADRRPRVLANGKPKPFFH